MEFLISDSVTELVFFQFGPNFGWYLTVVMQNAVLLMAFCFSTDQHLVAVTCQETAMCQQRQEIRIRLLGSKQGYKQYTFEILPKKLFYTMHSTHLLDL